jgi:hypothetical protein
MQQRRNLQTFSVIVLGSALACAPVAMASASSKHHGKAKPKHHPTKTVSKGGSIRGASSA